jgi:AAA15 family ATPase/GTPase
LDILENNAIKSEAENQCIELYKSDIDGCKKCFNQISNGLILEFNTYCDMASKYKNGTFILAYFNADRQTDVYVTDSITKVNLKPRYGIDDSPSTYFVEYLVDLKAQQSFARNEGEEEIVERIQEWFNNFESALRDIFEDYALKLQFNYRNYDFKIIQEDREPFGFDVLSSGYSAVLNIVMDLILRMELYRGYYAENKCRHYIYDLEGIVLIDEIETHLHIELQKKILPFLIKLFPKIQFIVSTHSPFVLSSVDNAVVYDLENKIRVEDLSKYSYKGIVESYFDIDQYSNEIKNKLERYKALAEKSDKTEDEKDQMLDLREYLKGISPELAPELVYEFREIELKRKK